ncbi:hypothetical protein ACOZ4N_00500 (plasmid) [Halorientalis pallida]|uniref:hypothetical protein n=1 Tax=Halorientalis pallida TaxID=2479928 RepID=UPI003C6F5B97
MADDLTDSLRDSPIPPDELPDYLVDAIDRQDPDRLRLVSNYALSLAGWKERQAEQEVSEQAEQDPDEVPDEWDEDDWEAVKEEAVDKAGIASTKGTITTKTINGNDYYYLQWREGEKIKSQYISPVSPSSSE